jgi:hypothetical protein
MWSAAALLPLFLLFAPFSRKTSFEKCHSKRETQKMYRSKRAVRRTVRTPYFE